MSGNGWVRVHRTLLDWEWYQNSSMVHLFLHILLKANHEPGSWQGVRLEPGQFISGRYVLACETGLSEQTVRTCLTRLKSTNELTIKSTNKYSVFTVNNWIKYQSRNSPTSKLTNNQPTTNQQLTTNKNDKNDKNTYLSNLNDFLKGDHTKWITSLSTEYPDLDIPRTIRKITDYWKTDEGFTRKKKSKAKGIDWKATIKNGMNMEFNQVRK